MKLKLERPLIVFDLETTGLDFKYDRIIEIGAVKIFPDGKREILSQKYNPGMRIPEEVTALTGISNADVENCPGLDQELGKISDFFEGCDIAGYNVIRFDAKVMVEEFRRGGLDFNLENRSVVDSQVIYHKKEKRDLAAAYKYYCDKELKDAHTAQADTDATVDILLAQLEKYPDLPTTAKELDGICRMDRDRFVDSEGKFFWRDGQAVFNFGKHKSKTLKDISKSDPNYLNWVISPDRKFAQDVVDICYNAMNGKYPAKEKK